MVPDLKKKELSEPQKLAMVLRTIQSNHGSHRFLLFSHKAVLVAKKTTKTERFEVFPVRPYGPVRVSKS